MRTFAAAGDVGIERAVRHPDIAHLPVRGDLVRSHEDGDAEPCQDADAGGAVGRHRRELVDEDAIGGLGLAEGGGRADAQASELAGATSRSDG